MSRQFMTLEEFLTMPVGMVRLHAPAAHWLELYRTAKASFEAYGDDGPPVGSDVTSLVSGYGGQAGVRLRFNGVCAGNGDYFELTKQGREYWCERKTWWRDIKVIRTPT